MSANALAISTPPFMPSTTRALAFICIASQIPVAMPQPMSSLPSRIERGAWLRCDQPNFSAPRR